MNRPALKILYQQKQNPRQKVWITDIDKLNMIVSIAEAVCIQPDRFNLDFLAATIRDAQGEPCGDL